MKGVSESTPRYNPLTTLPHFRTIERSVTAMSNLDSTIENSKYDFTSTQDWFSFNVDTWTSLFPLVHSNNPRILEIGTWEGRSAVFLITQLCHNGGEIVCIDHFDLMRTTAGRERYAKVIHNLSLTGEHFRVMDEFSIPALMTLLEEEMVSVDPGFDWIYVDGSHEADDTFLDGEMVWRLARKGAIVIFDDYHWDKEPEDSPHHPKRGIDAFMSLHDGEYQKLSSISQYQMILKKTSEMRIGFLVKNKAETGLDNALGYGINLVLTVDSRYAIPATVAIRSAVESTRSRLTIYIVDCGLLESDKEKIKKSLPEGRDTTLMFLDLPQNSLAAKMGAVWAKVDMITLLPVERALYIDADILVRGDLKELWDVDLQGNVIGAVTDVGFPMGHEKIARGRYFNAGVLLMDLAKIRAKKGDLEMLGKMMKDAKFRDQDALNVHFATNWLSLDVKWNAQGLGTYANIPSADRRSLRLEAMMDPCIVHFTGPVSPGVVEVLNPYLQPYTAKPWGYAGAPGHPYRDEWWILLEQTAWKGLRFSKEYKQKSNEEKEAAIQAAIEEFRGRVEKEELN